MQRGATSVQQYPLYPKSQDRQERDAFVNGVFKAAGLPLLHVSAKRGYVMADLADQLAPYLGGTPEATKPIMMPVKAATSTAPAEQADQSPRCPKCGGEMVLRTAKTGANAGLRFGAAQITQIAARCCRIVR